MAVTITPARCLTEPLAVLEQLQQRFPQLEFVAGSRYSWSPSDRVISYDPSRNDQTADWSLLHETGHALLDHAGFTGDFELLQMEMAAWARARQLADDVGITIDEDHIEDCLDTYRDWLHKRSICPGCTCRGLQLSDNKHYRCFNCATTWRVTPSRFGRAYRTVTKH